MPRIYDSQSNPIDFCLSHFPSEGFAFKKYGNVGDGPDGRGNCYDYNSDHPDYADSDHYTCEKCHKRLTERDNGYED